MSEREQERHVTVFHHLTLLRIPLLMQTVSRVFDVVWVLLIGQKYIDLCKVFMQISMYSFISAFVYPTDP